ncbi:MAG: hypothetical protein IPJ77_15005 [Planctomycetes bacterium]|nr:hypothetical protein [Planctomycetota bacterium]
MKLKILIAAIVILIGLFLLKTKLDEKKEYISGVPSSDTPAAQVVRQKFTVGFLPVT